MSEYPDQGTARSALESKISELEHRLAGFGGNDSRMGSHGGMFHPATEGDLDGLRSELAECRRLREGWSTLVRPSWEAWLLAAEDQLQGLQGELEALRDVMLVSFGREESLLASARQWCVLSERVYKLGVEMKPVHRELGLKVPPPTLRYPWGQLIEDRSVLRNSREFSLNCERWLTAYGSWSLPPRVSRIGDRPHHTVTTYDVVPR